MKIFNDIAIETNSFCNRSCSCCPVSRSPRPSELMSENTIYSIILELERMNYVGIVSLNIFNEPLLDKRLCSIIRQLRERLPKSGIRFASNGDLLTRDLFIELVKSGLSNMWVTMYDDSRDGALRDIYNSLNSVDRRKLNIRRFSEQRFIDCRAGNIDLLGAAPLAEDCYRINHQISVNWKGQIVLCCNDYYARHVLGTVKDDGLVGAWNSAKAEAVRKSLKKKDRGAIALCSRCNSPYDTPKSYFLERFIWTARWRFFNGPEKKP
jgi:MoaA/NifB/PqqE/SkfB family radical SAM enzyme